MEELLNERYSTSKMPQMRRELFRTAQPLPKLRNAPRFPERQNAGHNAEHGEGHCGL